MIMDPETNSVCNWLGKASDDSIDGQLDLGQGIGHAIIGLAHHGLGTKLGPP